MTARHLPLLLLAGLAAAVPLLRDARRDSPPIAVKWPSQFEGRRLTRIPPAPEDSRLGRGFPGAIARFTDGRRQLVLRQIVVATRQLHPARDCFKASGYSIRPAAIRPVPDGVASCFEARLGGKTLRICEHIRDSGGRIFSDVSSWYWPALIGTSHGPWLAVTSVERVS